MKIPEIAFVNSYGDISRLFNSISDVAGYNEKSSVVYQPGSYDEFRRIEEFLLTTLIDDHIPVTEELIQENFVSVVWNGVLINIVKMRLEAGVVFLSNYPK